MRYGDNAGLEETREADSLLEGSISESDTETELLITDPEGEYALDKAFLRLVEERGLSLR